MIDATQGIERSCMDCQCRFIALKPWQKRCLPCHVKYKFGPGAQLAELRAENARLRAENARLYGEVTAVHEARFRARCAMTKAGEPSP